MWRNIKHRLVSFPFVLGGVIVINFILYHLSPGDPSNRYFNPKYNQSAQQTVRQHMGMDRPLPLQLGDWLSRFIVGDFGYSWSRHRPVRDILKEAIPATVELAAASLLLTFSLGIGLGVIGGVYAQRPLGKWLSFLGLLFYSVPSFWLAMMLIYLFSLKLGWLPPSGQSSLVGNSASAVGTFTDHFRHLIMPAIVLGLSGSAAVFRVVQANTCKVLNERFILAARTRGLSRLSVILKHALKNILLPVITLFGLYFPFLLGGALVVEVIFAWPGMGRIAYEAVMVKDFPVIMAVNYLVAVMVLFGSLSADLLYSRVDPRI